MKQMKSCKDCKYFVQHYSWSYDRYLEICFGHCKQDLKKYKSITKPFKSCEFYEQREEPDAERKENFKREMLSMAHKIDHILKLLEK